MSEQLDLDDRYRILSLLGEGGTGNVYLARHLQHRRLEAVKVLKPDVAEALAVRFEREAIALNRLRHPNIVNVYDFGRLQGGEYFLAMEFADGDNLAEIVDREPIPLPRAIRMLVQLADGVDHAHCNGVIHRDLKPANIIVEGYATGADVIRILDFGVAKIVAPGEQDSGLSGNMVMGTPAYMAPEQAKGFDSQPSVDIYALGCIGYQLVTGRPPFVGRPIQILHCQISERPSPISAFTKAVIPPELEGLIMRCLRKTPETRPHSAATVANVLRGVLAGLVNERASTTVEDTLRGLGMISSQTPDIHSNISDTSVTPQRSTDSGRSVVDDQRVQAWQSALKRLAGALVASGCTDPSLVLALANANHNDGNVSRLESQRAEVGREREILDSKMHDRLLSLRFSLGELKFAKQKGGGSDAESIAMDHVINDIETQLSDTELQRTAKQASLDELEIKLAAAMTDSEARRDSSYRNLESVVRQLTPSFAGDSEIASMAADADVLRPASDAITGVNEPIA